MKANESTSAGSALVVVDMQDDFLPDLPRTDRTTQAVLRLIQLAIIAQRPIIILELENASPTQPALLDAMASYALWRRKTKSRCDGSAQVLEACEDLEVMPEQFIVCGVSFNACVEDTSHGLLQKCPTSRVAIIFRATNAYPGNKLGRNHENLTLYYEDPDSKGFWDKVTSPVEKSPVEW